MNNSLPSEDMPASRQHMQEINSPTHVAVAGDVYGGIVVQVEPQPLSTAERLVRAQHLLFARDFRAAAAELSQLLGADPNNALAKLYRATAILASASLDSATTTTIQPLERDLLDARLDPALAATAWAFLTMLAVDFDLAQEQHELRFDVRTCRLELRNAGTTAIHQELLALVPWSKRACRSIRFTS